MKKKALSVVFIFIATSIALFFYLSNRSNAKHFIDTYTNNVPSTILVYRFCGFSEKKAQKLANALKEYFPNVVYTPQELTLPKEHYNKERNRYLGTGLFQVLYDVKGKNAAIGLTNYIIYKPNEISKTFGIMGVSPVGKYICVVSNKIPRDGRTQSDENLVKLSLHELGHSFGLPHCPDQHCFMVDAEHRMKLPQSNYFCPKCKKYLNDKGWSIK